MEKKKVLVGISGGVDSAMTARYLMEQGYEVHGAYLALCPSHSPEGAKRVAKELGIPLTVVRREKSFQRQVVQPFLETYQSGQTPNPCVECNFKIKIESLLKTADRLGIFFVATGHYAGIKKLETGRVALVCGKDTAKDQSYFLWKLSQRQLSRLIFPLWEKEKKNLLSAGEDLIPREQKESMEVCFIPQGDTRRFLEENLTETKPGDFIDKEGKVLGRHRGIAHYTVGQRKGLGVSGGMRLFVTRILPEKNQILLGTENDLLTEEAFVKDLRWVSFSRKDLPKKGITFRGRHRGEKIPCTLSFEKKGVRVRFQHPIRKFSPGQSACFYLGELLAFGGIIGENE